jgi:hypothetical protein
MISAARLSHVLSLAGMVAFAAPRTASAQLPSSSHTVKGAPDRLSPPIPAGNTPLVLAAQYPDTIYAANITVDVDASGKALLNTLTLSGSAGEFNRQAIIDWLRKTTFRPAKRNGVPMRGTFRMTAEALKQADVDSVATPRD